MNHYTVSSPFVWQPASEELCPTNNTTHQKNNLAGLRLAVKDLFAIQGVPTTAGNPTWATSHSLPDSTASAVERLTRAGAHVVGKTITDELAYSLNGQNIHYGTPRNPITPDRLPGGSSSGSATAVADELADIGLGTDTGGSIRVPASYNNLFGMRPTHGLIACDGLVPLAPDFDTVGTLTRDFSLLHKSMACLLADAKLQSVSFTHLTPLPAAITASEHAQHIDNWIKNQEMPTVSANIDTLMALPLAEAFRVLQGAQIWQTHGEWITANNPIFAPDISERFAASRAITSSQIRHAKQIQLQLINQLSILFEHDTALVIPTTPGCAPRLTASAHTLTEYRKQLLNLTAIAGLAGLPQLHLPLFRVNNAPCGLSLIGPKNSDLSLLALAKSLLIKGI